ncbi:uncharacterized protein LOC114735639 [Neltuma alba]|uniref:uncharacterized protein LOC114735639 n=1 Tax=Neltuma alba TaxID=207710 RepID=UPI0010A2ACF7|nr:uncharacterized protein LOC114735639 [Prosopis alba]
MRKGCEEEMKNKNYKAVDLKEKRSMKEEEAAAGSSREKEEGKKQTLERTTTEDINASAEAFINNFRKQLMIQRLQSIENYEQMLARGL